MTQDLLERYLRTRIPSGWFKRGSVAYVQLAGDAAHRMSFGSDRVYVVAPPTPKLESSWSNLPQSASMKLAGNHALVVSSSAKKVLLAEIYTRNGMFTHAVLSIPGEEALGEMLQEWQVSGVPEICSADGTTCILIERRVALHSSAFFGSAIDWLSAMGYHVAYAQL